MATVDLSGTTGATGHASPRDVRFPYLLEFRVTGAAALAAKGSALGNADILQIMDIPAETMVMGAGIEVITADTDGSADILMDLGYGSNVDVFVDGGDPSSTGYLGAGTNGALAFANAGRFTAADTLDIVLGQASSFSSNDDWVIRVFVWLQDIVEGPVAGAAVDNA